MTRLTAKNPMKRDLIIGLHDIERRLDMDREDIMLILLELNTEEKIARFMEWILSKTDKGELLAKPNEIVRTACEISDRLDENP